MKDDKMYTTPILYRGKAVTLTPKGSTKVKEQAKQRCHVEFSFYNASSEKMERFRVTKDGNRIKDSDEKLEHFEGLLSAYKELLGAGWNPFDDNGNQRLKRTVVSITLDEARELFKQYHKAKGTRKKSLHTYISKLNYFVKYLGEDKRINEVTDYDITSFLNHHEATYKWSGVTYIAARTALSNLFNFLKKNKYVAVSPVHDIETRAKLKTEFHQVFSDEDFIKVMEWLKENDTYTLLFVKAIYYTYIRPKELRGLRLSHIDLNSNTITIPASVAKNKRALPVHIDPQFREELMKLTIDQWPKDYYLFGSTSKFVSPTAIGENTPYFRFQKCLSETKLLNKNYSLYSIKHLSNVRKFKAGWTIAEICAANRHSSLVETETYLKHLLKLIPTDKTVPAI